MGRAKRTYGGVSADERRSRRRTALLDAAVELIVEDGVGAVSKRAVCARSQLNDRYFYEHFDDSDALLGALVSVMAAELATVMLASLDDTTGHLPDQVEQGIEAALDYLEADPSRVAVLLGPPASAELVDIREASVRSVAEALTEVFVARWPEHRLDRADTAMVAYACVSGARDLLAAWLRGDFDADRDHVVRLMTWMVVAIFEMTGPMAAQSPANRR